jgi:FixJ family two-component response regulator
MSAAEAKRILVVDDDWDVRTLLRILLEQDGYAVVTAEDGERAIEALRTEDVDAVVTDIKMPNLDGFGLLEHITGRYRFLPVIMLTGYVDVDMAVEAMKGGSVDYVTKPIRRAELMAALEEALGKAEREKAKEAFRVSQVYLLADGGKLIFSKDLTGGSAYDPDVFSSMLTAVRMFIKDSFRGEGSEVKSFEYGDYRIVLEDGEGFFLVVIGRGRGTGHLRDEMRRIIERIEASHGHAISSWQGDVEVFDDIETQLARLLAGEAPGRDSAGG